MAILICPECGEEYDDRLKCYSCDLFLEKEIKLSDGQMEILDQIFSLDPDYESLDDGEEDPDLEDPDIED